MAQKDYYSILGIDKNASAEDIKKAYKKLCLKYHPDRWANASDAEKKEAEDKFKEINEANSVLSDPKKKQSYDLFGDAEMGPSVDNDEFDPFERLRRSSGWNPFGAPQKKKGSDVQAEVTITLKEAFTGVGKNVTVNKPQPCHHCNGTGSADGKEHKCPYCNGTGMYRRIQKFGNATFESSSPCPYCGGKGKDIKEPCKHCGGTGVEYTEEQSYVDIPAGIFDGATLVVRGAGCPSEEYGGPNGDLLVNVHVISEDGYSREDANIVYTLKVNLIDAWVGCKKTVLALDGTSVGVQIPPLTKSGKNFVVRGRGFIVNSPFGQNRGDFIIRVEYEVPNEPLTTEQKKALEGFYNLLKK